MKKPVRNIALTTALLCGGLVLMSCTDDHYSFSNGKIIDEKTGTVADDLTSYDAICLVGKSPFLSESVFECANIANKCPSLPPEGGVLVARNGKCSLFSIDNMRVLEEYEYACSRMVRPLEIVQRHDVKHIVFAADGTTNQGWFEDCARNHENFPSAREKSS